jgi:hypothetical protein
MWSKEIRASVALMAVIGLAACGGVAAAGDTLPPLRSIAEYPAHPGVVGPDRTVEWADYSGDLRAVIEAGAQRHDCTGLQDQLTFATAATSRVLRTTGHTNAKLIHFIRIQLTNAGCIIDR